jgi:tRNA U34 5-methylaminomethyl-2-thiouridine-forming methyltransferase MnmC
VIKHISTGDGSSSLFVEELNETYHSIHGAIQESEHVFLKEGLDQLESDSISVLEVGMGTGLNVLLSCRYALQREKIINFTTIEPFPIPENLIPEINYPELIDDSSARSWFNQIHASQADSLTQIHDYFSLIKVLKKAEEFQSEQKFDIIFYDAFGPHAQPELWEASVFKHLSKFMNLGGVLVTYCAQGQFKRNLREAGFEVTRLPGPPGKREMTRAYFKGA